MQHCFDNEELRNLVQGKFTFRNCLDCNSKGWVLVDGVAGLVVESIAVGDNPSNYYQGTCDECNGLGGFLKIERKDEK